MSRKDASLPPQPDLCQGTLHGGEVADDHRAVLVAPGDVAAGAVEASRSWSGSLVDPQLEDGGLLAAERVGESRPIAARVLPPVQPAVGPRPDSGNVPLKRSLGLSS